MIIASGEVTGSVWHADGIDVRWACLARRGMLHSECEAVDLWVLDAGAVRSGRGRDGLCEAWYVVSGSGELAPDRPVAAGDLILRPPSAAAEPLLVRTRMRLLVVTVLPDDTAARLPVRVPEIIY